MSRYKKGKTNLDFTEARDSEWLSYQLGHMQVCTSLQTDNHASTPPLSFPFLPPSQQRQSTECNINTYTIYQPLCVVRIAYWRMTNYDVLRLLVEIWSRDVCVIIGCSLSGPHTGTYPSVNKGSQLYTLVKA